VGKFFKVVVTAINDGTANGTAFTSDASTAVPDRVSPLVSIGANGSANNILALSAKNIELYVNNLTDTAVTEGGLISEVRIGFKRTTVLAGADNGFTPQDGANEQILIGDQDPIKLTGADLPSLINFGGVNWTTTYSNGVFTLNSSGADAGSVQAMLRNMRYVNKSGSAVSNTDDNRVFSFTVVDQSGNPSTTVTSTMSPDAVGPALDC
jgi:hypothetical protein